MEWVPAGLGKELKRYLCSFGRAIPNHYTSKWGEKALRTSCIQRSDTEKSGKPKAGR